MKHKMSTAFGVACLALALTVSPVYAQGFTPRDDVVPPSQEHPEGMLEIDSEADGYAATYLHDVEYATYGDRAVRLQILMPNDPSGLVPESLRVAVPPRPLIVYVQGSAWFPQALYAALPQLADFAHRGYVVASIEYRPSTEAQAPAQVQDVKAAIRYLRANAARFNIDPARIGIWGDSSGGHLAALAGTSDGVPAFSIGEHLDQPSAVQAVVDFYGPTDFRKMNDYPTRIDHDAENSPESRVVGGPIQDEAYTEQVARYNPITYVAADRPLPPFLIMHGDKDALVPFNQSVLLYTALRDAGHDVTFYKVKGADHGVRFWTPAVLDVVHAFFDRHLK